jgi:hypothetical protein
MDTPEPEKDDNIRAAYEQVRQVLDGLDLCDTDLLTVLDMLEEDGRGIKKEG